LRKAPASPRTIYIGAATFEKYAGVTSATIEKVAARLSSATCPSRVDAVNMQNWLLRCGKESGALRDELADRATSLANDHPRPWAAYRALMASRLVALDKQPVVRPVDMGEIFRRLFAKAILLVVGKEAARACENLNLCAGLKAGIEGAIHALHDSWKADLNAPPHYGFRRRRRRRRS
jgi:hypothetical protein